MDPVRGATGSGWSFYSRPPQERHAHSRLRNRSQGNPVINRRQLATNDQRNLGVRVILRPQLQRRKLLKACSRVQYRFKFKHLKACLAHLDPMKNNKIIMNLNYKHLIKFIMISYIKLRKLGIL